MITYFQQKTVMRYLEERNQKIIDAVIQKADRVCPGALARIVYCADEQYRERLELLRKSLCVIIGSRIEKILHRHGITAYL